MNEMERPSVALISFVRDRPFLNRRDGEDDAELNARVLDLLISDGEAINEIMRIMFIGNHSQLDWPYLADATQIIESFWTFLIMVESKMKDDSWTKEFEALAERMSAKPDKAE